MELPQLLLASLVLASVASAIDYSVCIDCPPKQDAEPVSGKCTIHTKYDSFMVKDGWCCRSLHKFRYCKGGCDGGSVSYKVFRGTNVNSFLPHRSKSCCSSVGPNSLTVENFYCTKDFHCKEVKFWVVQPRKCACRPCKTCE